MVNIIDNWDVLAEYAGEKLGFYQRRSIDDAIEIRVQTGRIGFIKQFKNDEDPDLTKILDFCRKHGYLKITEYLRDEEFFK